MHYRVFDCSGRLKIIVCQYLNDESLVNIFVVRPDKSILLLVIFPNTGRGSRGAQKEKRNDFPSTLHRRLNWT